MIMKVSCAHPNAISESDEHHQMMKEVPAEIFQMRRY